AQRDRDEHDTHQASPWPDDAPEGERNRDAGRDRGETADLLRAAAQYRIAERCRHTQPVAPTGLEAPDAEGEMARIVGDEKERNDGHRARPQAEDGERCQRAERQPARPDEPVSDAAQRATERRAKTLDPLRGFAIELGTRQCSDGDRGEIGMRVEIAALPRERGLERRTVDAARQQSEGRLDAKADAVAEQTLIVPRALDREQAEEDRGTRPERQAPRAGARWAAHCANSIKSPTARPPRNSQRAPFVE